MVQRKQRHSFLRGTSEFKQTHARPTLALLPQHQAVLSRGKVMVTARADIFEEDSAYSPRPGVIWAEVAPDLQWATATGSAEGVDFTVPAEECPVAVANGMAPAFDWSKDFSLTWGSEFAKNWSKSLGAYKVAASIKPRAPRTSTRAAAVVMDRATRVQELAKTYPGANFQNMAFPTASKVGDQVKGPHGGGGYSGRDNSCGCEASCGWGDLNTYNYVYYFDDYCDNGYNQWGPDKPNDMWGTL